MVTAPYCRFDECGGALICISSITEVELLGGAAIRPEATTLAKMVDEFLLRVEVLPWNSDVAATYARFRTLCDSEGKSLATMDMLIASHAVAVGATLVSNDQVFFELSHHIPLEDWTV